MLYFFDVHFVRDFYAYTSFIFKHPHVYVMFYLLGYLFRSFLECRFVLALTLAVTGTKGEVVNFLYGVSAV